MCLTTKTHEVLCSKARSTIINGCWCNLQCSIASHFACVSGTILPDPVVPTGPGGQRLAGRVRTGVAVQGGEEWEVGGSKMG